MQIYIIYKYKPYISLTQQPKDVVTIFLSAKKNNKSYSRKAGHHEINGICLNGFVLNKFSVQYIYYSNLIFSFLKNIYIFSNT